MARPPKKSQEQWRSEIIKAAQELFLSKGYDNTSITDIMNLTGGAKGMFYRFFESKEQLMQELGNQMFFENNPFEAVKDRSDLNGLQKIRELLALNQSDREREAMNQQAVSILKDPRILSAAVEANRRVLTPLWFELLEEARQDGSIETEYTRELSELLPLVNFWLLPSVFPASQEEICRKCRFLLKVLTTMGLPLMDEELMDATERRLKELASKNRREP